MSGTISGTVTDGLGDGVADAGVEARDENTGDTFTTRTDRTGGYSLSVPDGSYQVSANKVGYIDGFDSFETGVTVSGNDRTVDLTLDPGYKVRGRNAGVGDPVSGESGVLGSATNSGGTNYGVVGVTSAKESGAGLYGTPTVASGAVHGVLGETDGAGAAGVEGVTEGTADGVGNQTAGVRGISQSQVDGDAGVIGLATPNTGVTYGVRGRAESFEPGSAGVYGESPNFGESYGVRGAALSPDGESAGVYGEGGSDGHGVKGTTDDTARFGLYTPDDAGVEGALASTSGHTVRVDGTDTLSLGPTPDSASGSSATGQFAAVGGGEGNEAFNNHSTVGGGKGNDANGKGSAIVGGTSNVANGVNAFVGGGIGNDAGGTFGGTGNDRDQTVAGGRGNAASAEGATVGGGNGNVADGSFATVPGGTDNRAQSDESFAAGQRAKARDRGAFVWADSTDEDFASDQSGTSGSPTGVDTAHIRATGGFRIVTGVKPDGTPAAGTYLESGGFTWKAVSARSAKHDVRPVDPEAVLSGVESMTVSRWAYDTRPGVDRMGPMAGEFYETFDLGADPGAISHVDADGVALAAIQGLARRLDRKERRIDRLEAANDQKDDRIDALEARVRALEDGDPC